MSKEEFFQDLREHNGQAVQANQSGAAWALTVMERAILEAVYDNVPAEEARDRLAVVLQDTMATLDKRYTEDVLGGNVYAY